MSNGSDIGTNLWNEKRSQHRRGKQQHKHKVIPEQDGGLREIRTLRRTVQLCDQQNNDVRRQEERQGQEHHFGGKFALLGNVRRHFGVLIGHKEEPQAQTNGVHHNQCLPNVAILRRAHDFNQVSV